jgi:hypothetical protein
MIHPAKIAILVIFFGMCSGMLYWRVTQKTDLQILSEAGLKDDVIALYNLERISLITAKTGLEKQQIDLQGLYLAKKQAEARLSIERVRLWGDVYLYGTGGLLAAVCVAVLVLAGGYTFAHVRRAGIVTYKIGKHSEIPVRIVDMGAISAEGVAVLTQSEFMRAKAPEEYLKLCIAMAEKAALRSHVTAQMALPAAAGEVIDVAPRPVPTFAELYARGELQEGKDLICGFNPQGEPQRRSLIDLKAVAVTGWQGSGKTLSMAYLTACTLIQCPGSRAIVIDPHSNHDEGLGSILRPLEGIGLAEIIRGAAISAAITRLDKILDDRLEGRESSKNRIVLVIDEMARLSKLPCFDTLMAFIERCTNEIRKANILFIGGSTKWTARHFKGRADIRGVMPSSLVHATKISQAELIIEDMGKEEKALLKQVEKPGTALLQTSSQRDPSLVRMPLITLADILHVAENLREASGGMCQSEKNLHVDDIHKKQTLHVVSQPVSLPVSDQVSESETPTCITIGTPLKTQETPSRTLVFEYMQKNRKNTKEMANLLGVSISMVKEVLAGRRKLTTERKAKLLEDATC